MYYTVTNTGDCTVYIENDYPTAVSVEFPREEAYVPEIGGSLIAIHPGEGWSYTYIYPVDSYEVECGSIDYDSEGLVVDGGQWIDTDGKVKDVGSNHGVIHIPLTEEESGDPASVSPGLTVTITAEPDAGKGKRVVGEEVELLYTQTNTGNCTIYADPEFDAVEAGHVEGLGHGPVITIEPGAQFQWEDRIEVRESDVENGYLSLSESCIYWYFDADKNVQEDRASFDGTLELTYPEGEEPGEKKAELTLTYLGDEYYEGGVGLEAFPGIPTSEDTFDPDDAVYTSHKLINSGNVMLDVYQSYKDILGEEINYVGLFAPGKFEEMSTGRWDIGEIVTPGTGTEELLGTTTISCYYIGCDPDTGEELCRTQTITRTWKVRRPGGQHLDPEKLPEGEDFCSLTPEALGESSTHYTLHACGEHSEAAGLAEAALASGDGAKALGIWTAEVDRLYGLLAEATDDEKKDVLLAEKAAWDAYIAEVKNAAGDEAAAEEQRLRCALMCAILHTAPSPLPGSITGNPAVMTDEGASDGTYRVIGELQGSDSAVTESYSGAAAEAWEKATDLLRNAKIYESGDVFVRGRELWQAALDGMVERAFMEADWEQRMRIASWRVSLDALYAAEKPFLEMIYGENSSTAAELLTDLYRNAVFVAEKCD